MPIRAYCRIPEIQKGSVRRIEGSCPELLFDLIDELKDAKRIDIATYLFNNPIYLDFLIKKAKDGTIINITTLPISGYNDKPKKVDGLPEKTSAKEMARNAFEQIARIKNISLRFFPHQYVWYGALYAGGGASYSFHVKAINAFFNNGKQKSILSSGNFLSTDPYHSDNIIVFENIKRYNTVFDKFLFDLKDRSISTKNFNKKYLKYSDEFLISFNGKEKRLEKKYHKNCFFSAPFYLIDGIGSNHYAGNRIIELINGAKNRVWICAQHFHDIISFDKERATIIKALYEKSHATIEYRFLKQVPHSSLADKRRAGIAETLFKYVLKAEQRYNRLTHDKFIIIDNTLIVSTANYTSTQFAFGKRKMDFVNDKKEKFRKIDNFSEVNGFAIIPNCPKSVLNKYEQHFNALWSSGADIEINL